MTILVATCSRSGDGEVSLPKTVALSPDGVQQLMHTYSPDGQRIAYWAPSADSDRRQLWIANADLTGAQQLPVTALALAPALWSPDGKSLAVASGEVGLSQVAIVPAGGGEARRITEGASFKMPIGWFRHGEELNYYGTAPGGVVQSFVYSVASGQSRPLVPGETRPALGVASPDGSHVAYFIIDAGKTTIWVADGNGANPRQVTTEGFEVLEQYSAWSPDSKELLYESRRTGNADLWIVPIDGGTPRQLTHDVRNDSAGVWSSDGKWIAFLSNRGRQTDVWVVPAIGGAELRVTDTPSEEVDPMQWRPGTATLTFGVRATRNAVWALDLANGKERRLTPDTPPAIQFHPSPDSKQIAYIVDKGGGIQDLAVVPTAGGDARTLVSGGGSVTGAGWSPDGQRIAFSSDRGGSPDIWIVDVGGGAPPRQVTNWPGHEMSPVWSLDGSTLYFHSERNSKLGDIWRVPAAGGEPARVTTDGNFGTQIDVIPGNGDLLTTAIGAKAGQFTIARVRADGKTRVLWDKTTALLGPPSPKGDVTLAMIEQPDGKLQSTLLSLDGTASRTILPPGQFATAWSDDGQWVAYEVGSATAQDIALLHVADGKTRRLMTTPDREEGAEFTKDGKTVLFRRMETVQRIMTADLSKLLATKR